jgi:hypothetical protein
MGRQKSFQISPPQGPEVSRCEFPADDIYTPTQRPARISFSSYLPCSRGFRQWLKLSRNKKLPAHKPGGRYNANSHRSDVVL